LAKVLYTQELKTIAIVGVGLIGGSIGLGLRAIGCAARRIGIGRRRESLDKALAYDAVDAVTLDPREGVHEADLVIVCTPIGAISEKFQQIAEHLPDGCLVTDVASTKVEVVALARKHLPSHVRFVGSHPIAGSEKTSVEYARADLFENAVCIVTPTPSSNPEAVESLTAFWRELGGHSRVLSPARHDHVMARISHLPHAVAGALVRLAEKGKSTDYAGTGFGDTTRVASGDPTLWRDIFASNRSAVLKAITMLRRELEAFEDALQNQDDKALVAWLEKAKNSRDAWLRKRYTQKEMGP
jgi:prephenate dehydrogenase